MLWRHVTQNDASHMRMENTHPIGISSRNHLQPTRSLYNLISYGSLDDFHSFFYVFWHWRGHFKIIWCLCIHHVPMHDWYTFRRAMFIISGDIAHWNMEKLPILHNGFFRCHGNVCYMFLIDAMFCKIHRIGPSNMYIHFEKNRLTIDDFKSRFPFFINSTFLQH